MAVFQISTANLSPGCIKMIKQWAAQGVMEDIPSNFGTNAEQIVDALKEEIVKLDKSAEVNYNFKQLFSLKNNHVLP